MNIRICFCKMHANNCDIYLRFQTRQQGLRKRTSQKVIKTRHPHRPEVSWTNVSFSVHLYLQTFGLVGLVRRKVIRQDKKSFTLRRNELCGSLKADSSRIPSFVKNEYFEKASSVFRQRLHKNVNISWKQ